jgi:glucose-6-phosphate dehydrogenase assembly protein OpcA
MIELEKTFDVAAVEKRLAELWAQTTAEVDSDEKVVLRARVANLMVFVSSPAALKEAAESMQSLTAAHPGRVLLLLGDRKAEDRDIEMSVESLCQTDKRTGARYLCGEEVTLTALGKFVVELPSAAIPLLVSDLSTFLCWRDVLDTSDEVLRKLLPATDRFVIDSVEFQEPLLELTQINGLFQQEIHRHIGISDLNWERLTLWRALLADFFDVPAYQPWLDRIDSVRIDFVAPEKDTAGVAPQALLIVGWLASRLGWAINTERVSDKHEAFKFTATKDRTITVELNQTQGEGLKPGRLVQVELRSNSESPTSFVITRSEDNTHILAEARLASEVKRGRLLPVRNRSTVQLLAREMEILAHDLVYQDAVAMVAQMVGR